MRLITLLKKCYPISGKDIAARDLPVDKNNDYIGVAGVSLKGSEAHLIELDSSGNIIFKDSSNVSGRTVKSINDDIASNATAISNEITNRQNAVSGVQTQVTNNTTAITNNATAIGNEVTNRINADTNLQTQITSNATAISNEVTNRTNADTNLQNQIDQRALSSRTVTAGTGLSGGGDLSANRTISMPNVGTAGTVGATDKSLSVTTDAQGRVTSIVATLISIVSTQISDFANAVRGVILTGFSTSNSSPVVATDSVVVAAGKTQAQINANAASIATNASNIATNTTNLNSHIGSTGNSHGVATTTVNGFMPSTDKLKLDNALGRIVFPLVSAATDAANTTYTAVGVNFVWLQSRNALIKSGVVVFNVVISTRNFQVRAVNIDTGAILGTSAVITTTGYYSFSITLPTTDCKIGLQVLKSTTGGTSPSLQAAQLALETI